MMKKHNLDEMQELKLLKIEHRACWLAYWGLLVTIILQMLLGNHRFENLVGEYFVFLHYVYTWLLIVSETVFGTAN